MTAFPEVEARFVKSSRTVDQCPEPTLPEYAFVGRSNVGKSSLLNMLVGRKDLAKTSGKPGKTRLINHFSIHNPGEKSPLWYLADLPGYGYAKVSKKMRNEFKDIIYPYLRRRENLVCAFVLVDIRHEPQRLDLEFMEYLARKEVPFAMIFTKADKLKPGAVEKHVADYHTKMLEAWEALPLHFVTSAENGLGRDALLEYIDSLNKELPEE